MKVILLQELKGRGGEGDIVDVANGFANNYLFPKQIAIPATSGNLKQLEQRKHNIAKREETRLENADKTKGVLEGLVIKVEAKVGEEGQLFGSVTSQMIAESLQEITGLDVDKRRIDLKAPIKTAGEHEVVVSLYRDIKSTVKIFVGDPDKEIAEEEAKAASDAADAAEASVELETTEDTIGLEAADSIQQADAAGNEEAAAEAAETLAEVVEAEKEIAVEEAASEDVEGIQEATDEATDEPADTVEAEEK